MMTYIFVESSLNDSCLLDVYSRGSYLLSSKTTRLASSHQEMISFTRLRIRGDIAPHLQPLALAITLFPKKTLLRNPRPRL
jgi:hypothetical protein